MARSAMTKKRSAKVARYRPPLTISRPDYLRGGSDAALGEDERALEELRQALANGLGFDTWTGWSPYYRPLYDDPRYQSLVAPR